MRYDTFVHLGLVGMFAVGATACGESIDSSDVKTSGVYADFHAKATGDGDTKVHAGLKTGGPNSNTFLTLQGGDELTFYADGDSYTPDPVNVFDQFEVYEKKVPKDSGGTTIKIEFTREDGTDATESSVELPKKFKIDAPNTGDTYSRSSDNVEVKLSNADSDAQGWLRARGDCLKKSYTTDFSGDSVTIPKSKLEDAEEDDAPDQCDVDVKVRRTYEGSVDSNYDSGSFKGIQVRTTTFTSKP